VSDFAQAPPAEVDFGIEIEFTPNSPDPSRVYRAMTNLIQACQSIDIKLAQTIGPQIKPVLFLEDIRTGSLTTFLRSALESFDDDAIKNLEWKKLVGSYLVKGKRVLVNYLKDRETMRDFRFEGKKLTARVVDTRWLGEFHKGRVTLHPGDALDVAAEETVKYGYDQEVLAKHYRVTQVRSVIPRADSPQ
jgi:hypothetical protein